MREAFVVTPKCAQELKLQAGERVTLRFGTRDAEARVVVDGRLKRFDALVSHDVQRALLLPRHIDVHCLPAADGHVRLGPLIGILAQGRRRLRRPFFSQTPYFAALVRMGRRVGLPAYVFRPADVDWEAGTVRAWIRAGGRWRRTTLPLPDVVYDRVQSRRLDLLKSTREAKRRLSELQRPMFNTGFFDKWEVYSLLAKEETEKYLPETKLVEAREDIFRFARRYAMIYVKPAGGSLGQGIMVLSRRANGRYNFVHYGKNRASRVRNLRSPLLLWRRVSRYMRRRRYVVQRGLRLVRYRGRRFDIRVLMQKDEHAEWNITAMYARVARPGSLRANLEAGGKAVNCARVIRRIFRRNASRVMARLQEGALQVARTLDRQTPGQMGELGIDIGIDRTGHPWVIEVNAKPLRQMEGPRRRLIRSILRPLRYAQYLAGF